MTKRKWIFALLTAMLVIVASCALATEVDSGSAPCQHPFKTKTIIKGSCKENGYEITQCDSCHAVIEKLTIKAPGHDWDEVDSQKPTCTREGWKKYECDRCGDEKIKAIEKLPHSYGSWSTVRESTCTVQGERERFCQNCGRRSTQAIDLLPHPFNSWSVVREATDHSQGMEERVCTACSYVESRSFYPAGTLYPEMEANEAIRLLQQYLIDNGYMVSRVDGDYGSRTVEGVKEYQRQLGFEPTGIAYPQTLTALFCTTTDANGQTTMTNRPHAYGEWTILTPATDSVMGLRSHTCLYCGFACEEVYAPAGTLTPGMEKSEEVKALQRMLIEKKIIKTVADGDYGPRTELGISDFQRMMGLEVTGIAYPETIEALKNYQP